MLSIARIDMINILQIALTCQLCEQVVNEDQSPKGIAITSLAALMS